MRFTTETTLEGVVERTFTLGEVPGILWSRPDRTGPSPLVLMGHPGGMHKRFPGVVARATHLVAALGYHVAAIDAPGHGDRQRSAEDAVSVERIGRARRAGDPLGPIVSEFNGLLAERAVPEWMLTLDALRELAEIGHGPVGYSGMTIATEIGIRLVATDSRIGAALFGGAFASEALVAAARQITVPVQYLLPWDDPEIPRDDGLALYDAFGSTEKTLHANPGKHQRIPAFETEDSERFFARHLSPS
jgi:dienelactone hydrolase